MTAQHDPVLAQIEFLADGRNRHERYVFVCLLSPVNFSITPETTLGGCPVESLGPGPRSQEPGAFVTLTLRTRADLRRLSVGQQVLVENIRLIEAEQAAV